VLKLQGSQDTQISAKFLPNFCGNMFTETWIFTPCDHILWWQFNWWCALILQFEFINV